MNPTAGPSLFGHQKQRHAVFGPRQLRQVRPAIPLVIQLMLVIIVTACALNHANACKTYRIALNDSVNLMQCTLFAQSEVAKWSADHPDLTVKQWKCALASANDI